MGVGTTPILAQQEVSVDQFTGTAHVTIPIATPEIKGLTMPVILSHAASGVKVDNRGGLVGVNWSLAGLPTINRVVRGLPDDFRPDASVQTKRYGWLSAEAQAQPRKDALANFTDYTYPLDKTVCTTAAEGQAKALISLLEQPSGTNNPATMYDSEPDVFSYSVPGHSGHFVFDATGAARTIPYDPIMLTQARGYAEDGASYINKFVLKTPEGMEYQFDVPTVTRKASMEQTATPSYFAREYYYYKDQNGYNRTCFGVTFATQWNASRISNPQSESIYLTYRTTPDQSEVSLQNNSFGYFDSANPYELHKDYTWLIERNKQILTEITTPTLSIVLDNNPEQDGDGYYLNRITISSLLRSTDNLVKQIFFSYTEVRPTDRSTQGDWKDQDSHLIETSSSLTKRRFLTNVKIQPICGLPANYYFTYHRINPVTAIAAIPPPRCLERDLWGYIRVDFEASIEPQIYGYPGPQGGPTDLSAQVHPNAPYRLFPLPNTGSRPGEFQLNGGDRRPAGTEQPPWKSNGWPDPTGSGQGNFFEESTLLGTLTEVRLPSGGKIKLEYEPHRFYDPVAQASSWNGTLPYYGPGTRIKTVSWTDNAANANAIWQKRNYSYTQTSGESSGRLLRMPCFALQVPPASATPTNLWAAATIRFNEDINIDAFEDRPLGYGRVTESVSGRGSSVTTFSLTGLGIADESSNLASAMAPAWQRTVIGLARMAAGCTTPNAPYSPGYDGYPLAPSSSLHFARGLPLKVTHYAEPVGTAAPVLVKALDYNYAFRDLRPASSAWVMGFTYDQIGSASPAVYACARYQLLTDCQIALVGETQTTYNQELTSAAVSSLTRYGYNAQGLLTTLVRTGSNGRTYRTRYKHAADYALPPSSSSNLSAGIQPLVKRYYDEKITGDVIETIEEVITVNTSMVRQVQLLGVTLNTYRMEAGTYSQMSRPYQVLAWQPATPQTYADSARAVVENGTWQWKYDVAHLRPELAIEEVNDKHAPVSVNKKAGQLISGVHLGYQGNLPALQLQHAYASEARFSDFESTLPWQWQINPANTEPGASAARTGSKGLLMGSGVTLKASLPMPASTTSLPTYRLSLWVKSPSAGNLVVQVITTSSSAVFSTKSVAVTASASEWQHVQLAMTLPSANRQNYSVVLSSDGPAFKVDDVLLLPTAAIAQSMTYDIRLGKTSETNDRGETTFYEYAGSGKLTLVRNHRGHIVRQFDRQALGQAEEDLVDFSTEGVWESGRPIQFTSTYNCANSISYVWSFGSTAAVVSDVNAATPTCTFPVVATVQNYTVTLQITTPTGVRSKSKVISIAPPPPRITSFCMNGVTQYDLCGNNHATESCLGRSLPPNNQTEYCVTLSEPYTINSGSGIVAEVDWVIYTHNGTTWVLDTSLPENYIVNGSNSTTSSVLVLRNGVRRFRVQCRLRNSPQVISAPLEVGHFQSSYPCQ
ncbi:hypothetical protein [Hymenobacter lucidus]|uniref:PKD domain-containing protein n=1 Tax=Hymenobacter lucidus TaxID=2880930 RepID=A0ABS8ARM2_9BACT|nr:hypothetical protein [Hymenobacter lucidus]MCB2407642.1 hypothetical protein [Hymenobacter lucidus]